MACGALVGSMAFPIPEMAGLALAAVALARADKLPAIEEMLSYGGRNRMSTKSKAITIGLVFTILGFMLDPHTPVGASIFGEPPTGGTEPTGAQMGALMLVLLIQAIAFGVGAAFLFLGRPLVARLVPLPGLATAVWLAIVWSLMSWMPHGSLHQTIGDDLAKLIVVEYVFHVTLVAAALTLAWSVVVGARMRAAQAATAAAGGQRVAREA